MSLVVFALAFGVWLSFAGENQNFADAAAAVAQNDTFKFTKSPVKIDVLKNDNLPENAKIAQINGIDAKIGDEIAIAGGNLTLNQDQTLTFSPDENFDQKTAPQFSYTISYAETVAKTVEDFEGIPAFDGEISLDGLATDAIGYHQQPNLATIYSDESVDWGIQANTGLNGSQSFYGGYLPTASVTTFGEASTPAVLPNEIDISNLASDQTFAISAQFIVQTPNCNLVTNPNQPACNEAYLGLRANDNTGVQVNSAYAIAAGVATNSAAVGKALIIIEQINDQSKCDTAAGGIYSAPAAMGQTWPRCTWASGQLPADANLTFGEYFPMSAMFRVDDDGNLRATLTVNNVIVVNDKSLGSAAARSWLTNARAAIFVDDHADNFSEEISRIYNATANVTGEFVAENIDENPAQNSEDNSENSGNSNSARNNFPSAPNTGTF